MIVTFGVDFDDFGGLIVVVNFGSDGRLVSCSDCDDGDEGGDMVNDEVFCSCVTSLLSDTNDRIDDDTLTDFPTRRNRKITELDTMEGTMSECIIPSESFFSFEGCLGLLIRKIG